MIARRLPYFSIALVIGISLAILLIGVTFKVPVDAQTSNCVTPDVHAPSTAWPQNATVTVNINSSQFTPQAYLCLRTAFDNWNSANSNNRSGVFFNVNFSSTVLITTDSSGLITSAQSGNVYQVNSSSTAISAAGVGVTGGSATTTSRVNAFTNVHPNVTDCTALTETMAHEIGHTFGLGECANCTAPGQSVMIGVACATYTNGVCTAPSYNDTSFGLTGPTRVIT